MCIVSPLPQQTPCASLLREPSLAQRSNPVVQIAILVCALLRETESLRNLARIFADFLVIFLAMSVQGYIMW